MDEWTAPNQRGAVGYEGYLNYRDWSRGRVQTPDYTLGGHNSVYLSFLSDTE